MKIYIASDGKLTAKAVTVADVQALLKLSANGVSEKQGVDGWKNKKKVPCLVCGRRFKNMPSHVKKHRNNMEQPVN